MDKAAQDNRANQINPNNEATGPGQKAVDNRADQLNPNNPAHQGK